MRYYKALDGFRGTAVLAVMLIHARFLPIGWVGVQMFFVLSGFLITGILAQQRTLLFKTFVLNFYWRRCLRIWPLYFFYCLVCGLAYFLFRQPSDIITRLPSLLTYTFNFQRLAPGVLGSSYLGHLWSLCVEEQFYLVWPFVLFFLPPWAFRRFVVALILAGPLLRGAAALLFSRVSTDPHYLAAVVYNLPTSHLDAFACGAFLAVAPESLQATLSKYARRLFIISIGLVACLGIAQCWLQSRSGLRPDWSAFGYPYGLQDLGQFVWGYTILNLTSAAAILLLLQGRFLASLFENRCLTFIGKISYGLYVWHLGILHLFFTVLWPAEPHSLIGLLRFIAILMTSLAFASASFFGFEKFFLSLKDRLPIARSAPSAAPAQPAL